MLEDELDIMYIKCPYCREVSKTDQWATLALTMTTAFESFRFGYMPKKTESFMCPACKKNCYYLDVKAL